MTARVAHAVVGPSGHGVVEAALHTAGGLTVRAESVDRLDLAALAPADVVHLHYTDKLFGATCESAADAFAELAGQLGRPVTVTLHDLPMPGQGESLRARRSRAYARVAQAASGVVTSSAHEATLLADTGAPERPSAVIPLPIDLLPAPAARPRPSPEAGVLGWIYSGKGHDAVARALPASMGLAALGAVSPGHDDLLDELRSLCGDRLRCTGFLPVGQLVAELRLVAVPVAAHREVSASASIGSWLAAGRRPLVADGPWVQELLTRCPGVVVPVSPDDLADAIDAARADPDSTWLADRDVGPGVVEVSRRLHEFCLARAA